jgi:hypothetical protein
LYGSYAGQDKYAKKGAVCATVQKGTHNYHIIGTQMQESVDNPAQYSQARAQQFTVLKTFIDQQQIPPYEPVIVAGKCNVDMTAEQQNKAFQGQRYSEFSDTLQQMNCAMPQFRPEYLNNDKKVLQITSQDTRINGLLEQTQTPQHLEYVWYMTSHILPTTAKMEVRVMRAPFCPDPQYNFSDLSNTYPVNAYFKFPQALIKPQQQVLPEQTVLPQVAEIAKTETPKIDTQKQEPAKPAEQKQTVATPQPSIPPTSTPATAQTPALTTSQQAAATSSQSTKM